LRGVRVCMYGPFVEIGRGIGGARRYIWVASPRCCVLCEKRKNYTKK
jgi:hypothetical protein